MAHLGALRVGLARTRKWLANSQVRRSQGLSRLLSR